MWAPTCDPPPQGPSPSQSLDRRHGTRGDSFGLDFSVVVEPARTGVATTAGECHWGGVAGTRFWIDRAEGLVGLYLTQVLPHTGLSFGHDFKRRSYAALQERRAAPRPASGSADQDS